MSIRELAAFLVAVPVAAVAGCGGATAEQATTAAASTERSEPEIAAPPAPWAELSFDDRKAHMAHEVLPAMASVFESYDQEAYAGFSCDGCHGDDMRERGFAMPSPALPALYPTGTPEQRQMVREHPRMVRFMFNRVLPTMQKLLGAEPFDEETGRGFSCFACHPRAEAESAGLAEAE